MAFDFPVSPTVGQIFQGYTWDGEKWTLQTQTFGSVRYDLAQTLTAPQKIQARSNIAAPLRGWIAGLTLSTAGASATFGVAAGEAADSTTSDLMQLAGAITKTTAAWAVGNGNGALDTGAIGAAAWYHVFLIKRPDTGVVDVLISLSATAPTLPANYTLFRRIGSMQTAASQWVAFTQLGDEFLWATPLLDINVSNQGTTATLYTLSVPSGLQVNALVRGNINHTSANVFVLVSSPDETVVAANSVAGTVATQVTGITVSWGQLNVRTNTSSQVRAVSSSASTILRLAATGWVDRRGREA
jgi:hypothetical protein